MHLVIDIFQGVGIAAAIGIRPFLPSAAAGGLAAAGAEIGFGHTSYSFLAAAPFLLVMVICAVVLIVANREPWQSALHGRTGAAILALVALALGALFFAGALAHGHHVAWPGLIGGVLCAGVGLLASRPFLRRLEARLKAADATGGLALVAEGSALVAVVLSVVVPFFGAVVLIALLVLLLRGRGADDAKFAGLRVLR